MSLVPGQSLSHYEVLGRLGAGGMGEVYRARDTRLEREVAIKVLPESLAGDEERLRRFEREAKTLAALNHPNVAGIHGVDQDGGIYFLALELVPGEDLAARLERGRFPVAEAIDVCRQIAEGLEAAHEAGLVHRDLKPANVRITPEGVVKILDFGLAKPIRAKAAKDGATTARSDSVLLTEEGLVLGTPTYMSPEQARGRSVDRRTDIWAFGCVLYECLAGKRAFDGEAFGDLIAAILEREADLDALPASTPARVRELIERCLEKDVRQRLRDIGEARVLLEHGGLARSTAGAPTGPSRRRDPGPARLLGGIALGALLGALGWRARTPAPDAELPLRVVLATPEFDGLFDGFASAPALSRDGRYLAYPGAGRLRVRSLETLDDRVVPGSESSDGMFWSPDSDALAFSKDGALWAWTLERSESRRIGPLPVASEFNGGIWLPDGTLYFSVFGGDLYAMPAAGGGPEVALARGPGEVDFHLPGWLPDPNEFVAVAHRETGAQQVFVFRAADRERLPLLEMEEVARASWSPTGHLLLMRNWSTEDLWAVGYEPGEHRVVGEPFPVESGVQDPSVAEDGSMTVVQGERAALFDLFWVARDGSTSPVPGGPFQGLSEPALSFDGARIAYSGVSGDNRDIWVLDVERGTRQRITSTPSNDAAPRWSADGRTIFFEIWLPGQSAIWRVDAEGVSAPVLVMGDATGAAPTADGAAILFKYAGSEDFGLERLELRLDAQPEAFVESTSLLDQPAVSPDGKWVAHRGVETGRAEIFLRPVADPRRRVQVSLGGGERPFWGPKGERLYFVSGDDLMEVLVGAGEDAGPQRPRKVLGLSELGFGATENAARRVGFGLSPDGERFLVSRRSAADPRAGIVYSRGFAPGSR